MARPKKKSERLSRFERELMAAAKEMVAHAKGRRSGKRYKTATYTIPDEVDVKELRASLHLTQEQFAHFIGASVDAIRHWENGRRTPEGTSRTLLYVLQQNPRAILDVLGNIET